MRGRKSQVNCYVFGWSNRLTFRKLASQEKERNGLQLEEKIMPKKILEIQEDRVSDSE